MIIEIQRNRIVNALSPVATQIALNENLTVEMVRNEKS